MLLQDAPADTLNFMIFGYAVILGGIALFGIRLWRRHRSAIRELEALRRARKDDV
jgi:hypothetical protein